MNFTNNAQIDREAAAAAIPSMRPELLYDQLAQHLRQRWEAAKQAKQTSGVEAQMLKNKRAREGQYEPAKLNAIKQLHGAEYSPVYMMLSETKCRAGESWIKDIMLQPNETPFDLVPTPIPELPESLVSNITVGVYQKLLQEVASLAAETGGVVDEAALVQSLTEKNPVIKDWIDLEIKKLAKKAAEKMKLKIADQFTESKWSDEFEKLVYDIVTYKAGFMKGPSQRKISVRKRVFNEMTGRFQSKVETRIVSKHERRSPWNIYPSPDSNDINDGYLFDLISLTPKALSDLIGVPGYNESAVREILRQYRGGGLREWTYSDTERLALENKSSQALVASEKIHCLEYWGSAQGKSLLEWGLTAKEVPDPDKEYDICAWMIGNHIIKAIINPDVHGEKPFHKASFVEDPDSFWGKGIPELIEDIQGICNAVARAVVNNVGIASGPQVEVNTDRLATGEATTLYPWKVWKVTTAQMAEGKAVNFFMPQMVVDKLLALFEFCLKQSDEWSGIPRYAHGDPNTKGASHTASGLSMLMSQAARGIKNVVKNIDRGIITSSVEAQYNFNIQFEDDIDTIGDLNVVAKGSSSLIAKEQQAIRRTEFMDRTMNPYDMQIIGIQGRAEMLRQTAKSLDLDTDKILPEESLLQELNIDFPVANQGDKAKGGGTLNAAGDKGSGGDFALFKDKEMANV